MARSPRYLNPGVRRSEAVAWAFYDFANSGYTTVVLTAVFNAYFVGVVAGNADWATLLWTLTLSLSYLIVMAVMPGLGAWADAHAGKKKILVWSTVGCVLATASLVGAGPGDMALAIVAIVVSNVCYCIGESMIAAFLPELAQPHAMGRVSGWGWSVGYVGGMLTLGLGLYVVLQGQAEGQAAAGYVPSVMLLTAAVFAVAALPALLLLRERGRTQVGPVAQWKVRPGLRQAWQRMADMPDFRWLLLCGLFYQAGIAVVITLAAVYAEQVMGFGLQQTMMLVFLVNIAAALGAFAFGHVQDWLGHRLALGLTLAGWLLMVVMAAMAESVELFWAAATLAGLCMGSSQSAGRTLAGIFAPAQRLAESFALWTFSGRLAAIIGPVTYGIVTWWTAGNHRLAIALTGIFFVLGLWTLCRINVERGMVRARQSA
ncbi:MAG: MFS transporter [Corticimicrobacter sp.]|uniref:MFS transporter n=1 Tax=Corticimicrobacter sp. TaxID=2678536 RepID=UPI0032D9D59C